jgi:hypothetical protein
LDRKVKNFVFFDIIRLYRTGFALYSTREIYSRIADGAIILKGALGACTILYADFSKNTRKQTSGNSSGVFCGKDGSIVLSLSTPSTGSG